MQSSLVSRNVTLSSGRTSLRLEPEFWTALKAICMQERMSLGTWVEQAAADASGGRTSAVRVSVLRYLREIDAPASPAEAPAPRQWRPELGGSIAAKPLASDGSPATIG